MAERYERMALGITSNLVFSQWDPIFQNPKATTPVIDRIIHHSVILEFDVPSYWMAAAQGRRQEKLMGDATRQKEVKRQK
jgi:DNA replication protein DnaC